MGPLPKVVSEDVFQNKTQQHGDHNADNMSQDELPFSRCSRADIGPGEAALGAQVAPQVGIEVRVVFGTGVPVGNDLGIPVMAVNCDSDVAGIASEAADRIAVWIRTRNGSAIRAADRMGNCFGGRPVTGIEDAVGARQEAEAKVSDTSRAAVLPAAYPWSVHPRSKDWRYRGSHRLVLHYIVPCMKSYGMCVIDDFLGSNIGEQILHEVQELHCSGRMQDGKLANRRLDNTKSIRGDKIIWVEGKEPGCENIGYLLSKMDKLITYADGKLGKHKIRGRHKVSTLTKSQLSGASRTHQHQHVHEISSHPYLRHN